MSDKRLTNSLFEGQRLSVEESIELTAQSLRAYGERYKHWFVAYSGGKDSTATVTLLVWLIEQGLVPRPESLTVQYSDTRMELTPLQVTAFALIEELRRRDVDAKVVYPEMDDRFFVYMFGRGVPPPSNTFRWCTSQLKIEPMQKAMIERAVSLGFGELVQNEKRGKQEYKGFGKEKLLTITGVRLGESAARDERIITSCSRDGAECGQGWLQTSAKEGLNDTLAPLLHWRVCFVWDWLMGMVEDHRFKTASIAEVYGVAEDGSAAENGTRTGCVGCNLASKDTALDTLLKLPQWEYLAPYKRLKPLYAKLKLPHNRLRKHYETRRDGSPASNQGRLGPLTMEARRFGLSEVLGIQDEINAVAHAQGRPAVSLINEEERARILELISLNTWPQKWEGSEATGDVPFVEQYRDGTAQPLLIADRIR